MAKAASGAGSETPALINDPPPSPHPTRTFTSDPSRKSKRALFDPNRHRSVDNWMCRGAFLTRSGNSPGLSSSPRSSRQIPSGASWRSESRAASTDPPYPEPTITTEYRDRSFPIVDAIARIGIVPPPPPVRAGPVLTRKALAPREVFGTPRLRRRPAQEPGGSGSAPEHPVLLGPSGQAEPVGLSQPSFEFEGG